MSKRNNKFVKVTALVVVLAFAVTSLIVVSSSLTRPSEVNASAAGDENKTVLSGKNQTSQKTGEGSETQGTANSAAKYFTYSEGGNVDTGVIFMNPITGEKDTLVFKVMINTHLVDLTQYDKLEKFVELRTDKGLTITDGFEWVKESGDSHHVSGILKIKNNYKGNPILDNNTGYLKLIFKNIAGVKEREHAYQGETLR